MANPRRFIHDFDLIACVENSHEDFYNTPKEELLTAMRTRLANLKDDEVFEAFGLVATSELQADEVEEAEAEESWDAWRNKNWPCR